MQLQGSSSQAEYAGKKKQTRREKFLAEMEQVVPWTRLVERLRPFYPKGERGRPPIGLERMLRLYFLQQWYGLADEALEDALYDSQALRGFAGIDLTVAAVPTSRSSNSGCFIPAGVIGWRSEKRGLLIRRGTIVDATIIAAPPSAKKHEPEPRPRDALDEEGQPVRLEHRDQARHHQGVAQSSAELGRGGRAGAGAVRAWVEHCSTLSRTYFATKSCAIAAWPRTRRNGALCSRWPTW
jgi:transposase-like protein DUF772